MSRTCSLVALVVCPFVACGGSAPASSTPKSDPVADDSAAAPSAVAAPAPSIKSSASTVASAADDDKYDDPTESSTTVSMSVSAPAKPVFPSVKSPEGDCWRKVSLTGEHKPDYAAIIAACGTPTGAIEYAAPVDGRLHSTKDKRDTFSLKLKGGLCYRFFGVADASIADLDIVIMTKDGDLIGEDKVTGPVAIVLPNKALCIGDDVEYQFQVEVDGVGKGGYSFGAWVRKK
ncbi:MAG: hypothetical protein ACHREM_23825 [Polyangiales bacterium]